MKQTVFAYTVKDDKGAEAQVYFSKKQNPPAWVEAEMLEAKQIVKDNVASLAAGKGVYYLKASLTDDESTALRADNGLVNVCKSAQTSLDKMRQAAERAARMSIEPDKANALLDAFKKEYANLERALLKPPKTKTTANVNRFAHLFARS